MIAKSLFDLSITQKLLKAYTTTLFIVIIFCISKILCGQHFFKPFEDLLPEFLLSLMSLLLKILLPILSSLKNEALKSEHDYTNAAH